MVKNKGKTQFYEKHCKNNEKLMKFDEKQCKNNEKIMKRFGSRTSTLARGLRPVQVVFPPEDFDPSTRGTTTGKHNGETKREHNGKKMEK